eukprot:TRINITY_DN37244_c0_g2_i1.p1 TRINITY_DN37244_c0_g2~~TRINITY_DN37244_c0_g2_i1.p1  ORF type:complete len:479 (+),score=76.16 TRINITY_DN37244_c0_g2_i1:162-1598(+)
MLRSLVGSGFSEEADWTRAIASYFLVPFNLAVLALCLSRGGTLTPPSKQVVLEAIRLVTEKRAPCQPRALEAGRRSCPGFFSVCGILFLIGSGLLNAVDLTFEAKLHGRTSCDDYSSSDLTAYHWVSCLQATWSLLLLILAPSLLFLDLLIHQVHWGEAARLVLIDKMGDLGWHQYELMPGAWRELEIIAAGSQGRVHLAECSALDQPVCVKVPYLNGLQGLEQVLEETAIWIKIQEEADPTDPGKERIVPLIGFCYELPVVATLLLHCNGGDLLHHLTSLKRARGSVSACAPGEDQEMSILHTASSLESSSPIFRLQWALEIARAVRTLHRLRIGHMDLKSDNVLLHDGRAYLADFGHAVKNMEYSGTGEDSWLVPANAGTLAFLPPELYVPDQRNNESLVRCNVFAADVFTFGFLLHECITLEREPRCRRNCRGNFLREVYRTAPTLEPDEMVSVFCQTPRAVSYTHLTLPTKRIV